MSNPTLTTERLNKQSAQALLDTVDNTMNRSIDPRKVSKYVADMISGNWSNDYNPIKISEDGHILDGQHRLVALSQVDDISVNMCIMRGLPTVGEDGVEIFKLMDITSRKPHDVLNIEYSHLKYPKEIVTIMGQLMLFDDEQLLSKPSGIKVSNKEIVDWSQRFQPLEEIDHTIERGKRLHVRNPIIKAIEWSFMLNTIGLCKDGNKFIEELAEVKMDGVTGEVVNTIGDDVPLTNPVAYLVKTLYNFKVSTRRGVDVPKNRFIQIFKAYEFYVNGREMPEGYRYSGIALSYPNDYPNYINVR